jgi:hypothetical protein
MAKDGLFNESIDATRRIFFTTMLIIIGIVALSTFIPTQLKESYNVAQHLPGLTGLSIVEVSSGTAPFINVFVPLMGILLVGFMLTLVFHWKRF